VPIHDAYARITPMELSFPALEAGADRFRALAEEARARGVDDRDPAAFVQLMEVGRAMRELRVPRGEGGAPEHGGLLYHLYHCWRSGNPLYMVDTHVTRLLVESEDWESGRPTPPEGSAYVQLPQHLIWARPDAEGIPESVDGFFWTVSGDAIAFLVAMGIRGDRPGFSVALLDRVPLDGVPDWVGFRVREKGRDFQSTLPGADLERLYEIRTAGEVLKLAGRLLLYLGSAAEGALRKVPAAQAEARADHPAGGPRVTVLPHTRVTLPS
jgi:hypothetical protein